MKLLIEPVERGADVVDFSDSMIVLSLAEPGSAKIEPQYRKPEAVQRLHRVEHDLVVQRACIYRMRMANDSRVRRALRSAIEQRL